MNYIKIHDKAVSYFRKTPSRERLEKRNPTDPRLKEKSLYVEVHHVIPRSLGGNDKLTNLVEVLPEEHIFLHMLRYRIYRKREDMLAIRFMLNGYDNDVRKKHLLSTILTKKIRMGYAWLRSHAQFLRKTEGWQTPDGAKRISEARKGTMPVREVSTGKILGSFRTDHPKVLSGEWVHHSKGRVQTEKEIEYKRQAYTGQANPNASGLSEEYFIEKSLEIVREIGRIPSWKEMIKIAQQRNFPWILSLRSRFFGEGVKGYVKEMEKQTGLKYDMRFNSRKKN